MTRVGTPYAPGTACWADLHVPDVDEALDFYRAVFAWEGEPGPPELGGYAPCQVDGLAVAGIGGQGPGDPLDPVWTTYLASHDADATAQGILAAGGTLVHEPADVPGLGRFAYAADPTGARFGVWQAGSLVGAQLVNEPGAMTWNELCTRNSAAAREFYADVFGYRYQDMSQTGFDYHAVEVDGRIVGGVMGMDEHWPVEAESHWVVYFSVTDTDAASARVEAAGGAVMRPASDSPYGRLALVRDPLGAMFTVICATDR